MEAAYYPEYAQMQRTHWWYQARAEILEAVLREFLPPSRDRHLLDIGCGPGGMRPMLAQFGKLVSTDFTFDALWFCRGQQLDHLVAADAMRLPFGSPRFDAVCAFDVIEHLADDALAARELYRVLKPGGIAMVTVPAFQWLWGRQDIVSHHFRRYTAPMLHQVLTRAGFEVQKLTYFNTLLFPPIAGIRLLYRTLGLHQGRTGKPPKSDFVLPHRGLLNEIPRRIFAVERLLLKRLNLPFGVSVLAVANRPK